MEVGLRPRWREAIRPRSSRWMELVPAMNLVLCIALAVLGIAVVGEGDGFRVSSGIHRVRLRALDGPGKGRDISRTGDHIKTRKYSILGGGGEGSFERLTVNANGLPEKISEVEHMSNMTKLDSFTVEEEVAST
eukprot:1343111-Amorphochlora_amoeboformis.AAC.1